MAGDRGYRVNLTPLASPTFLRFNPSAQQIFTLTPWGPFPVS
jgi:hypothetical protein